MDHRQTITMDHRQSMTIDYRQIITYLGVWGALSQGWAAVWGVLTERMYSLNSTVYIVVDDLVKRHCDVWWPLYFGIHSFVHSLGSTSKENLHS